MSMEEMEALVCQDSSDEAGLDAAEAEAAAVAAAANDDDNINTSAIDMLQEHEYNNDGSVDLAPELNVDENTILLPVGEENGLNADDPVMAFNSSDFLQEEEEVLDPMETHMSDEEEEEEEPSLHLTRSNRRTMESRKTPSQVPKKRRGAAAAVISYEQDDISPEKLPKRRGRKPGSKVINGQVFYPDEQGLTFTKNIPKVPLKVDKSPTVRLTPKPKERIEIRTVDETQCRICMSTVDLLSIFKKEHTKTYAEKVMLICPTISVQRKDFLPQFICRVCVSSLNAAFALKSQCEQTDAELRELLEKSIKKVRRPVSATYMPPESEPEDFQDPVQDQDFKLSDASPPSADDSDSDYGKPLTKRRSRRHSKKTYKIGGSPATNKAERKSPGKKQTIKTEPELNTSKSSELEADAPVDFSSGSEENYSPPKKRRMKKSKSLEKDGFTCRVCSESLPSREELKEHKKAMHSHYECELCGRKFRVQCSLKAHMEKHTNSGELKCNQCDKHFPNKTERRKHMVDVHNESPAQFVCEKCKRAFTTEVRLMKHNESRCPGFDMSVNKKRVDLESLAMGKDLFKCVAPLTTTYWSDSFSD